MANDRGGGGGNTLLAVIVGGMLVVMVALFAFGGFPGADRGGPDIRVETPAPTTTR